MAMAAGAAAREAAEARDALEAGDAAEVAAAMAEEAAEAALLPGASAATGAAQPPQPHAFLPSYRGPAPEPCRASVAGGIASAVSAPPGARERWRSSSGCLPSLHWQQESLQPAMHSLMPTGHGKRKHSATHGGALPLSPCGPQSVEEAWREHHRRVTSARQPAEAEGLVLHRSAHSASGYRGGAINKLPHGARPMMDRPVSGMMGGPRPCSMTMPPGFGPSWVSGGGMQLRKKIDDCRTTATEKMKMMGMQPRPPGFLPGELSHGWTAGMGGPMGGPIGMQPMMRPMQPGFGPPRMGMPPLGMPMQSGPMPQAPMPQAPMPQAPMPVAPMPAGPMLAAPMLAGPMPANPMPQPPPGLGVPPPPAGILLAPADGIRAAAEAVKAAMPPPPRAPLPPAGMPPPPGTPPPPSVVQVSSWTPPEETSPPCNATRIDIWLERQQKPAPPANAYQAFTKEQRPLLPGPFARGEREQLLSQRWKALSKAEKAHYKGDAIHVVPTPSPYTTFCRERRPLLSADLSNAEREAVLGRLWAAVPEAERVKYEVGGSRAPVPTPVPTPAPTPAAMSESQYKGIVGSMGMGVPTLTTWTPGSPAPVPTALVPAPVPAPVPTPVPAALAIALAAAPVALAAVDDALVPAQAPPTASLIMLREMYPLIDEGEQPQGKKQRLVGSGEASGGGALQGCSSPGPSVDAPAALIECNWTACSTSATSVAAPTVASTATTVTQPAAAVSVAAAAVAAAAAAVTSTATLASAAACSASRVLAAAHAHHVSVSGVLDGVTSSGSVLERPTSATADSTLADSVGVNGPSAQEGEKMHSALFTPLVLAAPTPQPKKVSAAWVGVSSTPHACKNCKASKVTCLDGARPCTRCHRLGHPCEDVVTTVKHACTNCGRAKVKCDRNAENDECRRCMHLGLVCVPTEHHLSHEKGGFPRRGSMLALLPPGIIFGSTAAVESTALAGAEGIAAQSTALLGAESTALLGVEAAAIAAARGTPQAWPQGAPQVARPMPSTPDAHEQPDPWRTLSAYAYAYA